MKAVIYIRVSTNDQNNSISMQETKCRAFCEMNGYDVVDVLVDEDVSGGTELFERPKGSILKEMIDNNTIDTIISFKLDRLFRSTINGLESISYLNSQGKNMCLIDMGGMTVDTSSPTGKMFVTMVLGFSELERDTIKERITSVLKDKKEKGLVYSGRVPFGFTRVGNKLKEDKKEIAKVKEFFRILQDDTIPQKEKSYRKLGQRLQIDHSKLYRIYNNELYEKYR